MNIIVTGSRGTIGKVLMKTLKKRKHTAIPLIHDEVDFSDQKVITAFLEKHQPDAIMHLAKSEEAITATLAKWAYENRKSYLYTSSYKVFSGKKVEGPFKVTDTPDGTDELALYKQRLEKVSFENNPNSYVARLSWQITDDPSGYGILMFLKAQMDKAKKVSVSENMYPSLMFIDETANALIDLVEKYQPGLYHLNQNDWYSFYDIVDYLIHEKGHDWIVLDPPRAIRKIEMLDNQKIKLKPLSEYGIKYHKEPEIFKTKKKA
jgi:dTDP-4-dehydrorhamnose reductase